MLNTVKIKQIEYLASQTAKCKLCILYKNGRAKPFLGKNAKAIMIAEAPADEEVIQNTPLVGATGEKWWKLVKKTGFRRNDFFIINACNCKFPSNRKATDEELKACNLWSRHSISILRPPTVLLLGGYAQASLLPVKTSGVVDRNAEIFTEEVNGFETKFICSVHPSFGLIYNPEDGMPMLKKALKRFKNEITN